MDSSAPYGLVGWDCITPSNSSSAYLGRFTYGYQLDYMNSSSGSYVSNPSQAFHYAFYSNSLTDTALTRDTLTEWIYSYKDKYTVSNYLDCKDGNQDYSIRYITCYYSFYSHTNGAFIYCY